MSVPGSHQERAAESAAMPTGQPCGTVGHEQHVQVLDEGPRVLIGHGGNPFTMLSGGLTESFQAGVGIVQPYALATHAACGG